MTAFVRGCGGVALVAVLAVGGCTEKTGEGAAEGAAKGAAAGAIGALVVGVIFNDRNVGERVARAAVAGAAIGATVGAANAAEKEARKREAEARAEKADAAREEFAVSEAEWEEVRREIGDELYNALVDVFACERAKGEAVADRLYTASEDRTKVYALYVKAIAAADAGEEARALALYAELAVRDPEAGDAGQIREDVEELVAVIRDERPQFDISPTCAA